MTEVSATYHRHVCAGIVRRLYQWCINAADKPHATWLLGIVSFVESSFFPIPPDAMLIPMSLARPQRAWFYATMCTLTSVAGGLLGYFIGAVLYDTAGVWLIHLYGYGDKVEAFLLNRYGARARGVIEKRLGLWTGLAAVGVVVGFIVVVRVF